MQIPLTISAAAIWFSRHRLGWQAIVVAVLLMGSSPAMQLHARWQSSNFDRSEPHKFLGPDHRSIIAALRQRATTSDVLVAGRRDKLWLAPEYPGRHYAGHFFLTVDFQRKQSEVDNYYRAPEGENRFLSRNQVRFLYVSQRQKPERFRSIPGLVPIRETAVGTLFEYAPARAR